MPSSSFPLSHDSCSRAWVYHLGATRTPHVSDTAHPRLMVRQISLLNSLDLPTIPPPTTASPFRCDRFVTLLHRRSLPRLSPQADRIGRRECRRAVKGSPIASRLPDRLGRSEFALLRTGCSFQVAPHPSSRKRSYHCQLQAGNVSLVGTCTLLFKRLHRRTGRSLRERAHFRGAKSHVHANRAASKYLTAFRVRVIYQ